MRFELRSCGIPILSRSTACIDALTRLSFILYDFPPVIQLIVFGYACNLDVDSVRLAWIDSDHTPQSRELLDAFKVQAILRVLPGFAGDILRGQTADVQCLIDGTSPNSASLISAYATHVAWQYSVHIADKHIAGTCYSILPFLRYQPLRLERPDHELLVA